MILEIPVNADLKKVFEAFAPIVESNKCHYCNKNERKMFRPGKPNRSICIECLKQLENCLICDEYFPDLKAHEKFKHKPSNSDLSECPICEIYMDSQSLDSHIELCHNASDLLDKPYKYKGCNTTTELTDVALMCKEGNTDRKICSLCMEPFTGANIIGILDKNNRYCNKCWKIIYSRSEDL